MAIKVISSQEPIDEQEELDYPVLMQDECSGSVVLFTEPRKGLVVLAGTNWYVGEYHEDWLSAENTDEWKKFQGTLFLSNEQCLQPSRA